MRDNFSNLVIDTLAKRVGMRCSNPGCRLPTSGPQDEQTKTVNIGVAAHITAASPGGPRYNSDITSDKRRSIENGIWLCQTCAKLVDNDPQRYTESMLLEWKNSAEDFARTSIESPTRDYGMQLKPIDRLKLYLKDKDNWVPSPGEGQFEVFHYEQYPEFTVIENSDFYENYDEPWISHFPDKQSSQLQYFGKYHGTTIAEINLVCCDGGRFLITEPQRWLGESPAAYYYKYFFIKDSIGCLAEEMITTVSHHNNCRAPSVYDDFESFDTVEYAYKDIELDFQNGMNKYAYYKFDKNEMKYSRVRPRKTR